MHYVFSVSSYENPALETETALALDARAALSLRKRGAAPSPPKKTENEKPEQPGVRKTAGIVLMVLGGAALVYVLTMQQRSKLIQIAGFLLIGLGLMVMRSGAPAGEAHASPKSTQKAQKLMSALRQNNFINGLNVTFSDDQMTISTRSKNTVVEYSQLHSVIETQHMWFVTYGQAGVVLQKCDLTEGNPQEFLQQIAKASGCSTEIVRWSDEAAQNTDETSDAQTTGE